MLNLEPLLVYRCPELFDSLILEWSLMYSGLVFCTEIGEAEEKAVAPHSSTLAWKIPWMEEPGGLQSMGSLRVGHD